MPRPRKQPRLEARSENDVYYILWHDGCRDRRTSTGTRNEIEAQAALANFLLRQGAPAPTVRAPDKYQIALVLNEYLQTLQGRPSADSGANNVLALTAHWGTSTVDAITKQTVNGYIAARRRAGKSDGLIIRELGVLRAALNLAFEEGRLTRAPEVHNPPAPPPRDLWLEHYEAELLIDSCEEKHVRLFVIVSLYTVARPGAVFDLEWRGQIDFTYRRVELNPPGWAQTKKRRPPVPMADPLYDELLRAHAEADCGHVISFRGKPIDSIKTGIRAAKWRARKAALQKARRLRLGSAERVRWLEAARKFKAVIPYTLRHTGATWMAQGGVSLDKIAAWMGHSNARTTELYAKHHPDYLQDASAVLGRRLRLSNGNGA